MLAAANWLIDARVGAHENTDVTHELWVVASEKLKCLIYAFPQAALDAMAAVRGEDEDAAAIVA